MTPIEKGFVIVKSRIGETFEQAVTKPGAIILVFEENTVIPNEVFGVARFVAQRPSRKQKK